MFRKLQPVDQAEADGAVILNGNRLNQFAEQCLIEGHQQIRPIFQNVQKLLCALDCLIVFGTENAGFFQICIAALLSQLIALEYKNIRIDHGLLLELGNNRS